MMDETIYKISLAAFLHDIGKFSERASYCDTSQGVGFFPNQDFLNRNMDLYQPHFQGKYTHRHATFTAAFIDHLEKLLPEKFNKGEWGIGDSFINLTAKHHKPETVMEWIVAISDRISSGFDRKDFEDYNNEISVKDYKKTRLLTLFEGIEKENDDNLNNFKYRYSLKELSPQNVFPIQIDGALESDPSEEYRQLFFNFVNSLEKLEHKDNVSLWLDHFDSLFCIYASYIPAATVGRVVPDVSLYDHSRMTAALASAIYLYHNQKNSMNVDAIKNYEERKFLIVTGDFYGIQNFIFSEGGSTNKASAKLLRGRSFVVSLISEMSADLLCREIGLTNLSIILNAAGKFTIIAPNTEECIEKINSVQEKINKWLIKWFYGECSFGLSYIEASPNDFVIGNFDDLLENIAKESDKKKVSKIDLDKYGGVISDYLDTFNNTLSNKICPFCGKRPSDVEVEGDSILGDEKSACKICRDHIYIGTNLVKSEKIAITLKDADIFGEKLKEPLLGEYQLTFDIGGKLSSLSKEGSLIKYWDIAISENGEIAKSITAKFINGYVPTYDETDLKDERYISGRKSEKKKLEMIEQIKTDINKKTPKTFAHIAVKSQEFDEADELRGIEALGVLKADVDNLGAVFGYKLKRKTLSRLASMSRQLNAFFTIFLPYTLKTNIKFKDIYTVFAGGDDLFVIGPWNKIIDFASFLKKNFEKYVCTNSAITISVGITINKAGDPVNLLAERCESALQKSKEKGRDSITIFDETVKWEDFEKLESIKYDFEKWLENKFINNAVLFKFNRLIAMAKQEKELMKQKEQIELEDIECLKWHSLFKYNLVRNIGKELKGDEKEKAISEVEKSAEWISKYTGAMKIPLWQIIYSHRRGG